jgi:hypothetical protein
MECTHLKCDKDELGKPGGLKATGKACAAFMPPPEAKRGRSEERHVSFEESPAEYFGH